MVVKLTLRAKTKIGTIQSSTKTNSLVFYASYRKMDGHSKELMRIGSQKTVNLRVPVARLCSKDDSTLVPKALKIFIKTEAEKWPTYFHHSKELVRCYL